ncbi:MAG TPA: adenylate/guanylate cyclase domain-containing protein [Methylomirabilota bacterium]|nr:adenylate/guanylate cyclase domain-containing protein [Methylomirabilota bacterium]
MSGLLAWWRQRRRRLVQLWVVGLTASVLVTAASSLGYLEGWQASALDMLQKLQGRQYPSDVRIVAIDKAAFEGFGGRTPIPRDYLARVIRGIARSGAAVVGVDIRFDTPTTREADAALARAIREFNDGGLSRVVLLGPLSDDDTPLGARALGGSVLLAVPDVPQDEDNVIRRVEPVIVAPGQPPMASLGLAVAARMAGLDGGALTTALATGTPLPLPRARAGALDARGTPPVVARDGSSWPINYVGPVNSFMTIPSDVLAQAGDPGNEPPADNPLRGRIVLLGGTFEAGRDSYKTPHGIMPGVEVHANVAHMLATRRFIRPTAWFGSLLINASVVLVAGLVLSSLRPLTGTLLCVAGSLALGIPAAWWAFDRGGYWIDFVLPVAAASLMGIGSDALERRRFRDSFARYLSREVMAEVLADAPSLRGEHREVSILFSDLRGFTTLSEQMQPERIAAHLNEYFDAMTNAIFAHRGTINDFVGDAVMGVFGAPVADPEHAWNAVQSALDMSRALDALNERWSKAGLPNLRMGIGIHTGFVFAGNVGGRDRIKYTVIGDPVNVASRVEGLNKELGTTVLVTEETLAKLGDRVRVRDCGPIAVKGRVEKVRVYEVLIDGGSQR